MQNITLYIKLTQNAEVSQETIFLKDIAKLTCKDTHVLARAKALKVYQFKHDRRQVLGVLKIIQIVEEAFPGITVTLIGTDTEVVVERIQVKKKKDIWILLKILFVGLICFFGTAFSVMAFHNDIGINQMFTRLYFMITGETSNEFTVMEVAYSIGLATGIIVFFNHIGSRKITKDPTPVEVEMRIYESDVNNTLIDTANREGTTIDVS